MLVSLYLLVAVTCTYEPDDFKCESHLFANKYKTLGECWDDGIWLKRKGIDDFVCIRREWTK